MMPSRAQLRAAFPGGPLAAAQRLHTGLREQERAGRLMRDVQPLDNCTSQHHLEAVFSGTGTAGTTTASVDFGRLSFTQAPALSVGSKRLGLTDDPAGQPFDPVTFFSAPLLAQVLDWVTDAKGYYVGAKVLLFAVGSVPDGFRAEAHLVFTGPAIRRAPYGGA